MKKQLHRKLVYILLGCLFAFLVVVSLLIVKNLKNSQVLGASIANCPILTGCGKTSSEHHFQKIAFLGDSLTLGYFASQQDKDFKFQFLHMLHARDPLSATDTSNASAISIPGEAVPEMIANLKTNSNKIPSNADLIIVEMGTNDHNYFDPNRPEYNTTKIAAFASNYQQLLRIITQKSPNAKLMCLGIWQSPDVYTQKINNTIKARCVAFKGGLFVNISPLFTNGAYHGPAGRSSFIKTISADWFHPNDAGHYQIAQAIFATLLPYIPQYKSQVPLSQPTYTGTQSPVGGIDQKQNMCNAAITGWACAKNAPNDQVRIDVYIDGTYASCGTRCYKATIFANQKNTSDQSQITRYCSGSTANHQFVLPVSATKYPMLFDGKYHTIYLYAIGGKNPLLNSAGVSLACGKSTQKSAAKPLPSCTGNVFCAPKRVCNKANGVKPATGSYASCGQGTICCQEM